MILVTGATGTVGGYLIQALGKQGAPVRALVRSPEKADILRGYNCQVAVGRFEDADSLDAALRGVDRVFLICPLSERLAALEGAVIDAVRRRGAAHVVKLAAAGVTQTTSSVRLLQPHRQVVGMLADVPHTVLAPNGFFQNLLGSAASVQEHGVLPSLAGDAAMSFVDARDVAAVAAHVLTSDGHEGATYTLTGPHAVTYGDIAARLSALIGREVTATDVSPEEFRSSKQGWDPWLVEGLLELNAVYLSGAAAEVTDEVQKATGSPGRTVMEFLADHLSPFL